MRNVGPFVSALTVALGLVAVSACASSGTDSPFEGGAQGADQISLSVDNRQFSDATLYAISNVSRQRLGTVSGNGQARFMIDWPVARDLSVEINLLAGQAFRTPRLVVSPGEAVTLQIEQALNRSFLRR